jgi:hypothetical protein
MAEQPSTKQPSETTDLPQPTTTIPSNINNEKDISMQQHNSTDKSCGCGGMEGSSSNPDGTGMAVPSYIYAIGSVEPRFPTLSLEKEFLQSMSQLRPGETRGFADPEARHALLSNPLNRHIVRQLCWVLRIEGLDTYILVPRNPGDFDMLIDAARRYPRRTDIDVVIGLRGPIASPTMCNGLMLPVVMFDQIYPSRVEEFIESLAGPEKKTEPEKGRSKKGTRQEGGAAAAADEKEGLAESISEVLERVMQTADNVGSTDEHRALNYLAVRYDKIYTLTRDMHNKNYWFTSIEVRPSRLSGVRKIVDVIFSYTNRSGDIDLVDKYFTRVDVTEEWPFLHTRLGRYFER